MKNLIAALNKDEAGFIVSAELVLISTIAVLGLVVGLAEVSTNVNQELEDVGSAINSLNQTYSVHGSCGHKGHWYGSGFEDQVDFCGSPDDIN